MRITNRLLGRALVGVALASAMSCEDDPHDLDYLEDAGSAHDDHDHTGDEDDAG